MYGRPGHGIWYWPEASMSKLNREIRRTFNRWYSQVGEADTAEILTGRDLNLCLGTVRAALADVNYDPQPGVCPLPTQET